MRIEIIEKYIADDGKSFDNKEYCLAYEERIRKGGIYIFLNEITKEELFCRYLSRGYFLGNYSPGKLVIFFPSNQGAGHCGDIYGAIADELGKVYDSHNFEVWQHRMAEKKEV